MSPREQGNIVTWWSLNTVKPILCDQWNTVILSHGDHLIQSNLSYVTKGIVILSHGGHLIVKPILCDQGNSVILSHGGHLIQSNLSYVTKGTV
jgi:hypothetical protein